MHTGLDLAQAKTKAARRRLWLALCADQRILLCGTVASSVGSVAM